MEERWRQLPMVGLSAFEIVGRRWHRGCGRSIFPREKRDGEAGAEN